MNRESTIQYLEKNPNGWDVIIIGGGATGLGVAVDAATRGYKTLLLERSDLAKGTSSRSTKLIHGGVRYLAQGDFKLVFEALHERGLLLKNAPHLTDNQPFVIPCYSVWKSLLYTLGLKIYDLLAGGLSLGKSERISKEKVLEYLPTVNPENLNSGVLYRDGQFDDSRLAINLAQTCAKHGGFVLNYMKVTGLGKDAEGKINEVCALDLESGKEHKLKTKLVINATGVFVDDILSMYEPGKAPMIRASQGTHLVLDKSFLPAGHALMIPKTSDGRVLFAIPWNDKVVVGTTDTLIDYAEQEPRPLDEEVNFILNNFEKYCTRKPVRKDVLSVFSGLRPLARPEKEGKSTKEISRNHKLFFSGSNLITITGGKWTTYRKMAEDTINLALSEYLLPIRACKTKDLRIHGYKEDSPVKDFLNVYGTDAKKIKELMKDYPSLREQLHPDYPYVKAQVTWAVSHEMARTVEDFLARRIRILFMDARAAITMAPVVAAVMARIMRKDKKWIDEQVVSFNKLAKGYLLQ